MEAIYRSDRLVMNAIESLVSQALHPETCPKDIMDKMLRLAVNCNETAAADVFEAAKWVFQRRIFYR